MNGSTFQDGDEWVDTATTCDPASTYNRHPDENWQSVPICHPTRFLRLVGLEVEGERGVYLPIILKRR